MTNQHLSETAIQQYALDKSACSKLVHEHISICEHCKVKAGNYELLFSTIKELPKPAFEFDLPGLILENVQGQASKFSWTIFAGSIFSVACIIFPAYIFRHYFINIFRDMSIVMLCLIIVSALIILVFQSVEIYVKYQRKMNNLNFY